MRTDGIVAFRLVMPALIASVAFLLHGCASLLPETCEQFEQSRKTTNYATVYRLEKPEASRELKPLKKNEIAAIQNYRMSLNSDKVRPCSHVKIQKELVIVRRANVAMTLEETREFFTEDGTRIAAKTEVLNDQLRLNGRYVAHVPLPIPKNAPPGNYRLTSTLVLKTRGKGKPQTLAKTQATFQVAGTNK